MPDTSGLPSTRHRGSALARALVAATVALGTGCVSSRPAVVAPLADPGLTARELVERTDLGERAWIQFHWWLNEEGQRFEGDGVARVEPPDRARLDLYLDNGETVARAVLAGGEILRGCGTQEDVLPPSDLMWSLVGVFRPGPDARLVGGDELEGGATRLRYATPDGAELHFELGMDVLRSVEVRERGRAVQRVELKTQSGERYPGEARYRNLSEYRELRLERVLLEDPEPFDPEIWDLREC